MEDKINKLREALKPFADKWLYPDDLMVDFPELLGKDINNLYDRDDEQVEEVWIKRSWIRAAREVLKDIEEEN